MVTIRLMEKSEFKEVKELAKKTFGGFLRLFTPMPKFGIIAVDNNKIVGGIIHYHKGS